VNAALGDEIYLTYARVGQSQGGSEERLFLSDKSQDAPIVVRVGVEVQDVDTGDGTDRVRYARNLFRVATLTKVWYGFEELGRHRVFGLAGAQSPVEVDGGAYEGEVGKGLRKVPQSLARRSDLLGVEPEVVGIGEHLLETEASIVESACPG
jgi:hypothetical protein